MAGVAVVVGGERFARQFALFAGAGGGLSSKQGVGGCEMADADELKAPDVLLGV